MSRKPWDLAFRAEPEEVAALRRIMRLHLGVWGLHEVSDAAQLCVSELVSNVVTHVGHGTPVTLAVSMSGTYLRIEVHDPDTRALPTLMAADSDAEGGRGMALIDAVADRWGVQLRDDRKVTWCELATSLASPTGHVGSPGVTRAEALLGLYAATKLPRGSEAGRLSTAVAEEAVIDVITDFLHWLRAHGCDGDEVLDRAQTHFEAEAGGIGDLPSSSREDEAFRVAGRG
ncbi:ATP-binding protein [Streptomyces ipomoeae]|uniref:ATP-binding protein n=1 Tax=Streptomyces ipomoeae TaxID=103232 RepID=UPI0029ADE19A|nr:ATP-binding protein [Streptomyces ipomoeae]MDX2824361.1 ATP-binding protein [Streptomyces ipomoeae]MDX2877017.1 ATP-binding protein [Streptomyces ipomoeae]